MKGYDFHRQKPLDHFIVDFFCYELMLAIEIDGSIHESKDIQLKDVRRQESIEEYGIKFLRFNEKEVRENIDQVIKIISDWIVEFDELSKEKNGWS